MQSEKIPALLLTKSGHATDNFRKGEIDKPIAGPGEVVVRIHSTALNPVDWKIAEQGFLVQEWPIVIGCDMSGTVESVGEGVDDVRVGTQVGSFTGVGKMGRGTFTTHCKVPTGLLFKKPDQMTMQQLASINLGILTASMGLWEHLKLKPPSQSTRSGEYVLIWGGSGNVGSFAVQLAALAGYKVITTCSPRNFEYVRSLGAVHVVDHHREDAIDDIRKFTNDSLFYAYDTMCCETATHCARALKDESGSILACCAGAPSAEYAPKNVKVEQDMLADKHNSKEGLRTLSRLFTELVPLVVDGKVLPQRVHQLEGGLDGIIPGLQMLKENRVSAEKLVVTYN